MSLLTRERWVRVDRSVEVSGHDVLDQSSEANVLGFTFRQLNPVTQEVVRNPVNIGVDARAVGFDHLILLGLLSLVKCTRDNPVILFCSKNFAAETE